MLGLLLIFQKTGSIKLTIIDLAHNRQERMCQRAHTLHPRPSVGEGRIYPGSRLTSLGKDDVHLISIVYAQSCLFKRLKA